MIFQVCPVGISLPVSDVTFHVPMFILHWDWWFRCLGLLNVPFGHCGSPSHVNSVPRPGSRNMPQYPTSGRGKIIFRVCIHHERFAEAHLRYPGNITWRWAWLVSLFKIYTIEFIKLNNHNKINQWYATNWYSIYFFAFGRELLILEEVVDNCDTVVDNYWGWGSINNKQSIC